MPDFIYYKEYICDDGKYKAVAQIPEHVALFWVENSWAYQDKRFPKSSLFYEGKHLVSLMNKGAYLVDLSEREVWIYKHDCIYQIVVER